MKINIDAPVIVRSDQKEKIEYLGRYKVERLLGQGAFGTVYRCRTYKGYEYAIKQINNVKLKKMMSNELDALKSVNSKYVVRYYEVFYDKLDHPCIVLELCEGGTLYDLMKKYPNNVLPQQYALQLFTQILVGFKEIQNAHLIHRDVKLQNILIKNSQPKIADFGLVAHTQTSNTTDGFAGTPSYMAPEILNHESYDQQVDIWSLGILLYAMLFNDLPFYEQSSYVQYQKILQYCTPKLNFAKLKKSRYQEVKQETIDLLSAMLVVDPKKRATLAQLLELQIIKDHDVNQDLVIQQEQPPLIDPSLIILKQKQQLKSLNSLQVDTSPIVQKLKLFDFSSCIYSPLLEDIIQEDSTNISSSNNIDKSSPQSNSSDSSDHKQSAIQQENKQQQTAQKSQNNQQQQSNIKKQSQIYEQHILPYNQMLNRITQLVDTYELFNNSDKIIITEFNSQEINLILYFLSRVILFYLQGLNKILDERDNLYQLDNWSKFVFSKTYLNILSQVQIDLQSWMEKCNTLYQQLQLIQLISFGDDQNEINNESDINANKVQQDIGNRTSLQQIEKLEEQDEIMSQSSQQIIKENSESDLKNQKQSNIEKSKNQQQLKLLPEILENIIPPLDTQIIPQDFSFSHSKLPESLKISFRAVMITAYTRLYNKYKEETDLNSDNNNNINNSGPLSLSHIPNSNVSSQSSLSTFHLIQNNNNNNNYQSPQLKKNIYQPPSLILQSPKPNTIKQITFSTTNLSTHSSTNSNSVKKFNTINNNNLSNNNSNNNSQLRNQTQTGQSKTSIQQSQLSSSQSSSYLKPLQKNSVLNSNSILHSPQSTTASSSIHHKSQQSLQIYKNNNLSTNNINNSSFKQISPSTPASTLSSQQKSTLNQSSKGYLSSTNLHQTQQKLTSQTQLQQKPSLQKTTQPQPQQQQQISKPISSINNIKQQPTQSDNIEDIKQQNMLNKLRYSFRILLCCTLNHIISLNDQTIKLIGFQKYFRNKCNTDTFTSEELLKQFITWQRDIDEDTIESHIEFIFKNYLPHIHEFDLSFF